MKISEIFESIQGEGIYAGKPAVFLRTALCNLKCSWCDTKYTWDWDNYNYDKEVKEVLNEEILNQISRFKIKHLVITGGEPLLQQDEIANLLARKELSGYFIEVETNCTIVPTEQMLKHVDQWNVSPKTSNSDNKLEEYEISECYNLFSKLENSIFKFVTESEKDFSEVNYFVKKYNIPEKKVMLMPQASNKEEMILRKNLVSKLAKSHNLGFSPRIHIEKWDNQRGK